MPCIPLPALKCDEQGNYVFCPLCAWMWAGVAVGVLLIYIFVKEISHNARD